MNRTVIESTESAVSRLEALVFLVALAGASLPYAAVIAGVAGDWALWCLFQAGGVASLFALVAARLGAVA